MLTPIELSVLAIERQRWNQRGAKEQHVHDVLGVSAPRYFQVVNRVIDLPEALELDPTTVNRLRRLREQRKGARRG